MARVTQYHSETTNAWLHVHPAVEKSLGTPGPMRVCSWAPGQALWWPELLTTEGSHCLLWEKEFVQAMK
ncbi:uncharacterized [Tachysurus ichikawai]